MGQNGQSGGATPQGADMYGRQGTTPTAAPGTPAAPAPQKAASNYPYSTPQPQYGSSAGYTHTQPPQDTAAGAYGPSRAYGKLSILLNNFAFLQTIPTNIHLSLGPGSSRMLFS